MRHLYLLITTLFCAQQLLAQQSPSQYGTQSISSDFFEDVYVNGDLVHYLDNLNLHTTYQAETTGAFNTPDQLIFSLDGNSYRWNSYYLDGFRIDSRYFSGSTLYKSDVLATDLDIDYIGSNIRFSQRDNREEFISASYNVGGLGGISPYTKELINLFHYTASERAFKPITERNKINGAGTFASTFATKSNGKRLYHNIMVDFGERNIVDFDNRGIYCTYPESYASAQFSGDMGTTIGSLFDKTHYLLNYAWRTNMGSEFYYSQAESSRYNGYSASIYGSAERSKLSYTSGLTFAVHNAQHSDINFSRNILDHDGEAFEPFRPDGNNFELSHAILLNYDINNWLKLSFDGYNSALYASPSQSQFSNALFAQSIKETAPTPLYTYKWHASNYASGLLENSLKLSAIHRPSESVILRADAGVTLDAMLLGGGKSKVSPNIEAQAGISYNPSKWFATELTLARHRVSYTIEDIQFMSDDYLNADIYFASSGNYFTSTGGAEHTMAKGLNQSAYYTLDLPINFTFGRHRISLLQSARKYTNNWITSYDRPAAEYGTFEPQTDTDLDVFFLDAGAKPTYIVDNYPGGIMGDSFLTSSPFLLSSNIEYSYSSPRFFFSLAWQSYTQSGLSTLGNGPLHNNLGVLSESSANPNTHINTDNSTSRYMAVGRLDQERAYVMRMLSSYKFSDKFTMALSLKFKDGQPFSFFKVQELTDASGNQQMAIIPATTRGINTFDGDFGTREDACFNLELRAKYTTEIAHRKCQMQLQLYNLYDFGTELTEYVFDHEYVGKRFSMSLNIPRGLIFSVKYFL